MIDWRKILDQLGIDYKEGGKSTAKNNIYVSCPWCGESDGQHLGISVKGKGWGCWRRQEHRGTSATKLIAALTGMSFAQAARIVGEEDALELVGDEAVATKIRSMLMSSAEAQSNVTEKPKELKFPSEIRLLKDRPYSLKSGKRVKYGVDKPFRDYLIKRGYEIFELGLLSRYYGLHYALSGLFQYRLIFPVFGEHGDLVTWTGRTVVPDKEPRYLSLTMDPELAKKYDMGPALANIKDCLFNEYELFKYKEQRKLLIVVEGPFDAMRVDFVGRENSKVNATCMFGKTVSDTQLEKLDQVARKFKYRLLLTDPDASMDNFALWNKLKHMDFEVAKLDGKKYKDPAEMIRSDIHKLVDDYIW